MIASTFIAVVVAVTTIGAIAVLKDFRVQQYMNRSNSDRTKRLLKQIDEVTFATSAIIIFLLTTAYFIIDHSVGNTQIRSFFLAVITNLIPTFLLFSFSFVLLRKIQKIRTEQETDNLVEQISERIRAECDLKIVGLLGREHLPVFWSKAPDATEIFVVGVSLISVVVNNEVTFEKLIKDGRRLRFLLLDPKSPAAPMWDRTNRPSTVCDDIDRTLNVLSLLKCLEKTYKGQCLVRLSQFLPPFSSVLLELPKGSSQMLVEFHTYNRALVERPHIMLKSSIDDKWFGFYKAQCEQLWQDSVSADLEDVLKGSP